MTSKIRVLLVEDNENDAELLLFELQRGGYEVVQWRRVETATDMRAALAGEQWDIVLSDFSMPTFSGPDALVVLQEAKIDVPFIIVSGTVGEETAVTALKSGAHDFLVKGKLTRFLPVVERELREAAVRHDRVQAQLALQVSERRYRRIVETAQEGIWMLADGGRTTYLNQHMAEMLGCSPEMVLEGRLLDFVDEHWREVAQHLLDDAAIGKHRLTDLLFRRHDGSEFWGSISTSAIHDEDHAEGILCMVTDVTDHRKLQMQLMISDRMATVGMLAAGVAHEINNPLAAVLLDVEVASRRVASLAGEGGAKDGPVKAAQDLLTSAKEAALRVSHIVRDLRIFSRAEEEKLVPVNVQAVLDSAVRIAWNEIRHRARLTKNYQPVPPVEANESRLGQVFLNFLINAAQAIPEGNAASHEIYVGTRSMPDGRVAIEVCDSGVGMNAETMRRLFVPFFTTKPAGVGTGLGLSISQRIVNGLRGEIQVESELDKGSMFRVLLPPSRAIASTLAPSQPSLFPSRAGRILLVDDDLMVASGLQIGLSTTHEVRTATTGKVALDYIRAGERFDIILCDLMMPEMSGIEPYEVLAQQLPDQAQRMIFLTGGAFTPRARAFLAETGNLVIEKPIGLDDILRLIDSHLISNSMPATGRS